MACNWFSSGRARQRAKTTPPVFVPPVLPPPVVVPPTGPIAAAAPLRVTDEQDGELLNRTYAYWPNAVVLGDAIYAFVGHADGRPRFFRIDRATRAVERLGSPVRYTGTGEGWYWSADGGITLCDGPRLRQVHPFTGADRVVLDITDAHPGCRLWQAHSSDDGRVHSATVERITNDGPYERVGTVVYRDGQQWHSIAPKYPLDESQIDPTGRFLIIKEVFDVQRQRVCNRIFDLEADKEAFLAPADGALGHSDCGPGYIVGENSQVGACAHLDMANPLGAQRILFSTWGMGAVSVRGGRCLLSNRTQLSLVSIEAPGVVTPLLEHGMVGDGYDYQVHANLSPDGRVASWVSNAAGRFDLYVMELGG